MQRHVSCATPRARLCHHRASPSRLLPFLVLFVLSTRAAARLSEISGAGSRLARRANRTRTKPTFYKATVSVSRDGVASKPISCTPETRLLSAIITEGGSRFARARALVESLGFEALHFPAVFVKPRPPCVGFEGLRLASRNVWRAILATNTSMVVFEDDVILHAYYKQQLYPDVANDICRHVKYAQEAGKDLVYLGYIGEGNVRWGTHAMWITPFAAKFLLANTASCYTKVKGDGVDSQVVAGCRQKNMRCWYAKPKDQKPVMGASKRHGGGFAFFIQDRVSISSYLHSGSNNAMTDQNAIKRKPVWD